MKIRNNMGGGKSILKNKAFTLIELLAVIVILAIIALIAVPIVLNIIENTKDSSVIRSTELYLDAVELYIARNQLDNKQIEDGQYSVQEFTKVEVNGQAPSEGMVELTAGKIIDYSLKIGEYTVNYDETKKKPVIGGKLIKAEFKPIVDLIEGMTAVQYVNDNWTVIDGTTKNWYNYNKQEWANAVILETGITKNIGDTIDVSSEVKAMFVYVPRYEYKIEGEYGTHSNGTEGTQELPGEIKVKFIPKNTVYENTNSEGYRMHPAFKFGNDELNGIWVGKFETSHETLSSSTTNNNLLCSDENCENADGLRILPNVSSLRRNDLSNMFYAARSMTKSENSFELDSDSANSHYIKNSEWGAVAYLSQSKYGKYGNSNYSGAEKQVRINNCSNYITGIGADNQDDNESSLTCTTNTYETEKGQTASTTGNITGVYDMSGGSYEYTMGIYGSSNMGSSGFNILPEEKYFDLYTSRPESVACNSGVCYGHALSETVGWYNDLNNTFNAKNTWIDRGGDYSHSSQAGIFYFSCNNGHGGSYLSFHIVLVSTK